MLWLPVLGIFNVRTDVDASHTGAVQTLYTGTVRTPYTGTVQTLFTGESALKVDTGRKIPCHTRKQRAPGFSVGRSALFILGMMEGGVFVICRILLVI